VEEDPQFHDHGDLTETTAVAWLGRRPRESHSCCFFVTNIKREPAQVYSQLAREARAEPERSLGRDGIVKFRLDLAEVTR